MCLWFERIFALTHFFHQDWHQKEKKLKENVEVLESHVRQLKEENQELLTRLQCTHSKEGKMTWDAHNYI